MDGTDAATKLKQGDIILAVNDTAVITYMSFDELVSKHGKKSEGVTISVLREGQVLDFQISLFKMNVEGTTRCLIFCGMILQPVFPEIRFRSKLPENINNGGVFCTLIYSGSPAQMFHALTKVYVTEVNNEPTPDMDSFIEVTSKLEHREFIRFKSVDMFGQEKVFSLKLDRRYWPTTELTKDQYGEWNRKFLPGPNEE